MARYYDYCPMKMGGCTGPECGAYNHQDDTCPIHVIIENEQWIDLLSVEYEYGPLIYQNKKTKSEEKKDV